MALEWETVWDGKVGKTVDDDDDDDVGDDDYV